MRSIRMAKAIDCYVNLNLNKNQRKNHHEIHALGCRLMPEQEKKLVGTTAMPDDNLVQSAREILDEYCTEGCRRPHARHRIDFCDYGGDPIGQ